MPLTWISYGDAIVEGMDRGVIEKRLAETDEQLAGGQRQIAEQRQAIALLDRNGRPADHAKYLLAGLQLFQAARREGRNRLLKELAKDNL
jgi:hypothetical protein